VHQLSPGLFTAPASHAEELDLAAREIEHKRGQARLANRRRLAEWPGHAGTVALTFRWPQVRRMLRDVAAGLAGPGEENDHAVA